MAKSGGYRRCTFAWRAAGALIAAFALGACATGGSLDRDKYASTVAAYLERSGHKALAMNLSEYTSTSVWNRASERQAIADALEGCEEHSGGPCQLIYANDVERYDVSGHYSGGGDGFVSSFGQATGVFAAVVGTLGGDTDLANKGLETWARSSGLSPEQTPKVSPLPTSPGAVRGGTRTAGHDPDAVAERCGIIAQRQFPGQGQNELHQRAACLSYCAYNLTGIRRFHEMYVQNQATANSLCSVSLGNRCNDIRPIQQCNYR